MQYRFAVNFGTLSMYVIIDKLSYIDQNDLCSNKNKV